MNSTATLMPSPLPRFNVSETTNVRRGLGDIPAAKPKTIPETKNSSCTIIKDRSKEGGI